jgi:outer membrane immunogenic protein
MRELASATAGVLLVGVMTACAADMQVGTKASTAWNWTGLYIGANLGGVWGQSDIDPISSTPNALFAPFIIPPPILIIVPGALGTMPGNTARGTGFIGGMQLGYNWQINQILYGIEGDFDGSSLQSKATSMAISPVAIGAQALSAAYSAETDWIATIRGRLGLIAWDPRLLFYATGGLAFAETHFTTTLAQTSSPGLIFVDTPTGASGSQQHTGWTVGVGAEWAVRSDWSISAEYRHVDLGAGTFNVGVPLPTSQPNYMMTTNVKFVADQVTMRLNWRLGTQ